MNGEVDVLFVGGPKNGQIYRFNRGPVDFVLRGDVDGGLEQKTMDIQTFFWVFPGRVDRQIFRVAMWPGSREADVVKAALAAWVDGWAPPDSASEYWNQPGP